MRVTSQMTYNSMSRMINSNSYKEAIKTQEDEILNSDSSESEEVSNEKEVDPSTEVLDAQLVTSNVLLEKYNDRFVLSKIEGDTTTPIREIKTNTKAAEGLKQFFEEDQYTYNNRQEQYLNSKINTMSLVDFMG